MLFHIQRRWYGIVTLALLAGCQSDGVIASPAQPQLPVAVTAQFLPPPHPLSQPNATPQELVLTRRLRDLLGHDAASLVLESLRPVHGSRTIEISDPHAQMIIDSIYAVRRRTVEGHIANARTQRQKLLKPLVVVPH